MIQANLLYSKDHIDKLIKNKNLKRSLIAFKRYVYLKNLYFYYLLKRE